MSSSFSSLVDTLSEIYSKRCRGCQERKKVESVCDFVGLENNKLHHKCNICKKRWSTPISGLIKKFNKFILLLRKGVYPCEYMNSWERLDETMLPNKKAFWCEINLEDFTDEDYIHAQKVFEELKNEKPSWISWSICSKWYIIACGCTWEF